MLRYFFFSIAKKEEILACFYSSVKCLVEKTRLWALKVNTGVLGGPVISNSFFAGYACAIAGDFFEDF